MINLKKIIKYAFAVSLCLGITITVFAGGSNLYQHYALQGEKLPSIEQRAVEYGKYFNDEYGGTETQNLRFHPALDEDIFDFIFGVFAQPTSTVESATTAGWTDDGSNVRLNTTSDFVGIGTASPAEKLTVTGGNFLLNGNITGISGSIDWVGGAVTFGGTTLKLGTGTATTTITSLNGSLGIGTTTPANPNATTTLAIQGDFFASGTTTAMRAIVASTTQFSNGPPMAWPLDAGSNGNVLTTDGKGIFSYTSVTAPAATSTIFTSSGTWIRPAGVNSVIVTVVGGGAGGGGAFVASGECAAGGGGSGGYARGAIEVSGNVTVTIGAGGAGDTDASGTGVAGGNTTFVADTSIIANGGSGGTSCGSDNTGRNGGAGGGTTIENGIIGLTGQEGKNGADLGGANFGGEGGSNPVGQGGHGGSGDEVGAGGDGCGAGGGGGAEAGTTQKNGGAGADGCVIVEWF